LLPKLRNLHYGQTQEWPVRIKYGEQILAGRVCAMKRSPEAAEKERHEILQEVSKKQRKVSATTLELAGYLLIFTTLEPCFNIDFIIKCYRLHWQIELFFKRLKSILGLGCLPKYDQECATAYLSGKILIAVLMEAIIHKADDFSPFRVCFDPLPQYLA